MKFSYTPTVSLQGGLGNQLFQWSFAHLLSHKNGFFFDIHFDKSKVGSRNLELAEILKNCTHIHRNQNGNYATSKLVTFFHFLDRLWEFKYFRFIPHMFGYLREDPRFDQQQSLRNPKVLRYAKGYFQKKENVESVFQAIQGEIIPILDEILVSVKKKFDLDYKYSVLHVRRGDYATADFTSVNIGILGDQYFIDWCTKFEAKNLVLLTENIEDVSKLIDALNPRLILDKSLTSAWEILAIIYGASNFLGSNSSLSWWGARLCSTRGGQVWLPSQWSYWGNINPEDYHFSTCNIAEAFWLQTNLKA